MRTVWTVSRSLVVAAVVVAVFLYDALGLFAEERALPLGVPTLLALLFGSLYALGIPWLRYRFWRFALRNEELLLEHGIWNRIRTVVPLRRIQHIDVSQNLIEREFGVGKLIVHTAGTRANTVVVPGLRLEEAERLRDRIKHFVLEDTL